MIIAKHSFLIKLFYQFNFVNYYKVRNINMNFEELKSKITDFMKNIELSRNNSTNQKLVEICTHSIMSLNNILQFLEEERNIEVLESYQEKNELHNEFRPLDNICSSIINNLSEIDLLLNDDIVKNIKPETINSINYNQLEQLKKELNLVIQKAENNMSKQLLSVFSVLRCLNGHNKTLIIIGPNGSGKTSLANYLKKLESHIKVIPANKPIRATGNISSYFGSKLKDYNNELYNSNSHSNELLQKLIIAICSEHDSIARKYLDTDIKEESKYQKIKSVFDTFFDIKLDDSAFNDKKISASKNGCTPFEFNLMSDGERAGFFYIATVITAPENSFIIVDEPENHLNPAIYNKIWDALIHIRKDCQFIFISHTIDFIISRSNYELVKIKNFFPPDKFELEFLGNSISEISRKYIVEIIGSRKPILFCEGTKTDYDCQIYECLFGNEYTIIPVGNCITVKNSVIACNQLSQNYSIQQAIGIIDSDLKSDVQIEQLKTQKIFSLKCNEIEMLLLDEVIFKKVSKHFFRSEVETFKAFKKDFFKKLSQRKEHIIKRFVKTKIEERLHSVIIDDKNNKTKEALATECTELFQNINIEEIWNNFEKSFIQILEEEKYDEALRYCCLEHNEVLNGITNKYFKNYTEIALGLLSCDSELSKQIRNKYFFDIDAEKKL